MNDGSLSIQVGPGSSSPGNVQNAKLNAFAVYSTSGPPPSPPQSIAIGTAAIGTILNDDSSGGTASARLMITPGTGLNASTFAQPAYELTNTGTTAIRTLNIDLHNSLIAGTVFDPFGTFGDTTALDFTPYGSVPVSATWTYGPNPVTEGGYKTLAVTFGGAGLAAGQTFAFRLDADPASIEGPSPGPNESGSISGFEHIGALVTVGLVDGGVDRRRGVHPGQCRRRHGNARLEPAGGAGAVDVDRRRHAAGDRHGWRHPQGQPARPQCRAREAPATTSWSRSPARPARPCAWPSPRSAASAWTSRWAATKATRSCRIRLRRRDDGRRRHGKRGSCPAGGNADRQPGQRFGLRTLRRDGAVVDPATGAAISQVSSTLVVKDAANSFTSDAASDTFIFQQGFATTDIFQFSATGANHDLIGLDQDLFPGMTIQQFLNSNAVQAGAGAGDVDIVPASGAEIHLHDSSGQLTVELLRSHPQDFFFV